MHAHATRCISVGCKYHCRIQEKKHVLEKLATSASSPPPETIKKSIRFLRGPCRRSCFCRSQTFPIAIIVVRPHDCIQYSFIRYPCLHFPTPILLFCYFLSPSPPPPLFYHTMPTPPSFGWFHQCYQILFNKVQ